ncbi:MAG: hypothetical protein RI554_07525 [Trueperaceae bacterium]|nr:hypothetical protein [Trueperaceae bacterium]
MPYLFLFLAGTFVTGLMVAYVVLVARTMRREQVAYQDEGGSESA